MNLKLLPFQLFFFLLLLSSIVEDRKGGGLECKVQQEEGRRLRFAHHKVCPETGMMCVRRYILAGQVEVLASCLVEALIIAAAKPNRQGQQSSHVWEALYTAATTKQCC